MSVFVSSHLLYFRALFGFWLIVILPALVDARDNGQLGLNTRLEKRINGGEAHTYWFEARKGHYLRFEIGRSTLKVIFSITDPNGRQAARIACLQCDTVPLSVLVKDTGRHLLTIQSEDKGAVIGQYSITLAEERPLSDRDMRRLGAERALAEGESLWSEWNAKASRQALAKYHAALLNWRAAGDQGGQCRALRAIGDVHYRLGELQKAMSAYKQAYTLAGTNDMLKVGATLGLGFTSIVLGHAQEGISYATHALDLARAVGDYVGQGRALLCIGDGYEINDPAKATQYYEQALRVAVDAHDLRGEAMALNCLGYVSGITAQKQPQSRRYQEEALARWRLMGDRRGQTITLVALGHMASLMGEKQEALAFYHQAESHVRGCGEPSTEGALYSGLGFIYEGLGELQLALRYSFKGLAAWRAANHLKAETESLTQVARLYQQMDISQQAIKYLLQAKQIAHGIKDPSMEAWLSTYLGIVYADQGREKMALAVYQEALTEQARAIPWIRALALNGIGNIHQRSGNCREAISWYEQALTTSGDAHEPFGEVAALHNRARAERACGNLDAALTSLKDAMKRIERLRANLAGYNMRTSYFATTSKVYELTIEVLSQLGARETDKGYVAQALEVSERARARAFLDTLVEAQANLFPESDTALVEEERVLIASMAEKNRELAKLYAGGPARMPSETVERELEQLVERHRVIQSLIQASSPRYTALTQPQPLTVNEIQQLIDSETLLLEYSLGDEASYLWAVTANSVASFKLAPRSEIERAARQVYELVTAANKTVKGETVEKREVRLAQADAAYLSAASRLSQMLLAPVVSKLDAKRLLLVADGVLQYIAFAGLPTPRAHGYDPRSGSVPDYHPLILDHEIITLPSASALAIIRRGTHGRKPNTKMVAVIADPVFSHNDARLGSIGKKPTINTRRKASGPSPEQAIWGLGTRGAEVGLSRLPFSRKEATAILGVVPKEESLGLLDFEASKPRVTDSDLSQYRIVHFATHGVLNSEHPELSGIVLSLVDEAGEPQNGFLRLHDIYRLNLQAELVVLSACQTALGKEIKGEGLVGLTRGFMYAGAARVVASLWSVNDAVTADLMRLFYNRMFQDGQRPAEALRSAQIDMLKRKTRQSPYHWAAFTLQGDWK